MVTERPSRGVALGGVSVGVGAVCQTVADRLAADRGLRPSVWLERGGRLRCVAGTGDWPGRDAISPTAGVVGATFTDGVETIVPDTSAGAGTGGLGGAGARAGLRGSTADAAGTGAATAATGADAAGTDAATAATGAHAAATGAATAATASHASAACLPIRCDGGVVGVLHVALDRPLRAGDLECLRAAADELGARVAAVGGPPAESGAQRMLRHMTSLSALDEPDAIGRALLAAALDLMELDSAALVRRAGDADQDGATASHPALHAVAAIGPLGAALAHAPQATLEAIAHQAADGGAAVVIGTPGDLARPELASLRSAGARALVAVGLVAHAQPRGLLLLAGRAERAVPIDDVELLELLAAHAATCLRTADLMRSLRERAATDPLTGLGHHATFHETLARAHRRPRTAVVLVDVDGFKRLNDTYGHQRGDHMLRAIAGALSSALRRGDTLFRIGGDEFAALLVVSDADEALEAGMRLRAAVAEARLGVTVSIGVAVPQEGEPDAALLARADRALYRVKDAGRDGVMLADPEPLPVAPPL